MEKITFCIPSKSNLQYLKTCIPSIRKNAYRGDHDIIVFVDSDEDGTVEWLEANKDIYNVQYHVNPNIGKFLYGIGRAYDYCIDKAETRVVMIFHADMILGKHADVEAFEHLESNTVVCSTRIEPPIHPNAGEKILEAFGMYPEEFNEKDFREYIDNNIEANKGKVTNGIFAPWMIDKAEFEGIGGHDPRMHSCREDSDLFNRLSLAGFTFKQSWTSFVYHFTGRGAGSFSEDKERHEQWKRDMNVSTREFFRKWKSTVKHTAMMKPLVSPVYNIGIRVVNCNNQLLSALEPWAHTMYVDCEFLDYIASEKDNTTDDLFEKIQPLSTENKNDILINIDAKTFNQQDFHYLQQMGDIIEQSGQVGKSKLGNMVIEINELNQLQDELIGWSV